MIVQHFEWKLSEEVLAQAKYYQEQGGGAAVWSDILQPLAQAEAVLSPDNVSMQSCPVSDSSAINNLTFVPHHKRT